MTDQSHSSHSHSRLRLRTVAVAAAIGVLGLSLAACGNDTSAGDDNSITVYSGQHEDLTKALAAGFEKSSGISVDVRPGEDVDLSNQIIEEGDRSKADVYLSEEPGPMGSVANKGLLAPVKASTLAKTNADFNPKDGSWLGWAARARVMVYNPKLIAKSDLPHSLLDLSNARWKGKFAYAPSGAFVGTVTYLVNSIGEQKTTDWLTGINANGKNLVHNENVANAVEAGQIAFGLVNHYYWYLSAEQKGGPDKMASKLVHFGHQDPGGLVFASGAGVLKSSKHQGEAQKFLAWLADPNGGQKVVADDSPQYPLAPGVTSKYPLTPLDQLDPPKMDQASLADLDKAKNLVTQVGMI